MSKQVKKNKLEEKTKKNEKQKLEETMKKQFGEQAKQKVLDHKKKL